MLRFVRSWKRVGKTSTLGTFIRNKQIALLYYFIRAAITKYYRLGGLNNRYILSQFWRLEV